MSADQYVRESLIEKRGAMKWDKYLPFQMRLTTGAVLECYNTENTGSGPAGELAKTIDLVEQGLNDVKPNKSKGKKFKYGWQIATDRRGYNFASETENDRNVWIKVIQDTFQTAKKAKLNAPAQLKKVESRKWGSALTSFKENQKKGGALSALKSMKNDVKDIQLSKFREKKELSRRANMATLDTSSIFGCYMSEEELTDLKEDESYYEQASTLTSIDETKEEEKQDDHGKEEEEEDDNPVPNPHPITQMTLQELLNPKVQTFSSQLGCKASRVGDEVSFIDDLVASKEFCLLAIGKGLVSDESKKEKKEHKVYKRPRDDTDDEDDPNMLPAPRVRHPGTIREKVDFTVHEYKDNNFTISCEINCENTAAGNTIISNRTENKGFEFIAPRKGSRRVAIWREGSELMNVGKTELLQDTWYHVVLVCKSSSIVQRQNVDKLKFDLSTLKKATNISGQELREKLAGQSNITSKAMDFTVYLNGVFDGKVSLDGCPDLYTGECRLGSNIAMEMASCFMGQIRNFEIYDRALDESQIYELSHKADNKSVKQPVLLSYHPSSLKVEIPIKDSIKYNGPQQVILPKHQQWQPEDGAFTMSAWINCTRAVSKLGSVIVSNLTTSNKGFELICPCVASNVVGIRCSGLGDFNRPGMSVGTTLIECNRWYHIAVVVQRVITYGEKPEQTSVVIYLNGKQDGSYNMAGVPNFSGGDWSVGFNSHYKADSRFEGIISNTRIFQRALIDAEVACIYAADIRERKFEIGENVLTLTIKQNGTGRAEPGDDPAEHTTWLKNYDWTTAEIVRINLIDGDVKLKQPNGMETIVPINKIIKTPDKIFRFVPGTDAEHVNNLGGMIHGVDNDGNKWRIYCVETQFLRHITLPSTFSLLGKLQPFPKHTFEQMIENDQINNKYILNRLLNAAFQLLKHINKDKSKPQKTWIFFNEYILSWALWKDPENFAMLQDIARKLQYKYKKQQFDLFDELKKTEWDTFGIANFQSDKIENRQDSFDGGLTTECVPEKVGQEKAQLYDKQVLTQVLWGRCFLLNDNFQSKMQKIFEKVEFCVFEKGPQKTYERMVEKCVEYQGEDKPFPAAFQICDVLRCSAKCRSLNDVDEALDAVQEADNLEVVRIKNRFLPSFDSTQTDGYRDMLVNVLYTDEQVGLSVICEVQFHLQAYLDIKHKQHKYYKIVRAMDYKSLLRNYEARKFD